MTHDRYFLDNVAGWILELDRGFGIPWEGNYSSWLEQKDERLAQEEKVDETRRRTLRARARVGQRAHRTAASHAALTPSKSLYPNPRTVRMSGLGRVRFDLGPQPLHVDVERLGVADVVRAPDPLDQLAAGEDAAAVAQEVSSSSNSLSGNGPARRSTVTTWRSTSIRTGPPSSTVGLGNVGSVSRAAAQHRPMRAMSSRAEYGLVT